MSGVFQNIDPPPPNRPASVYPPAFGAGGGHTRWVERGWEVNSSEDARHCSVLYLCKYFVIQLLLELVTESHAWMKEAMDNTSRVGVCLRCPVFISVHFSLRDEGSSEYIRLCEGRESLSPNFQTFHDPRHQFHGISTLVSETLHPLATLALLHMIPWTFLHSLNV